MIRQKDAAVSPVVSVMLMLIVTIIIAAIVYACAGGIGSEQHKTPQVATKPDRLLPLILSTFFTCLPKTVSC
ncbi:MAG: type IV pilin [Methanomicrobiales archaeon]